MLTVTVTVEDPELDEFLKLLQSKYGDDLRGVYPVLKHAYEYFEAAANARSLLGKPTVKISATASSSGQTP